MQKPGLILNTIIHLRSIQIRYQLWYRIRKKIRNLSGFKYPLNVPKQGKALLFIPWIKKPECFNNYTFNFLNQSKYILQPFQDTDQRDIDKLWLYNLNYMDFLNQKNMDVKTGSELIENFIENLSRNSIGSEPYPIALRGINWIKFLSQHAIHDAQFTNSLYAQYLILFDNIEYHLLGNHLLEDGFSLLFGAFYFTDSRFYRKARQIIEYELQEQILDDGAHFELSPMYHQIILDRLLDCINLLQNNPGFSNQEELLVLMETTAAKMLSWLNIITFANGQIPPLNDSAPEIAPTTQQLNEYAASLNIKPKAGQQKLTTSGYRKFVTPSYECILDVGQIGPAYQPGHAHADTFSFVLNINNQPVFIDTGVSTYNTGETRLRERSTAAHNTVTVLDKNSSEIWSSFRVGRRAKTKIVSENQNSISAKHDGYKKTGTIHQREWNFTDTQIQISDTLLGRTIASKAHFWLAPKIKPQQTDKCIQVGKTIVEFENADSIKLSPNKIPTGYNVYVDNYKIEVEFQGNLKTTITIK